MYLSRNKKWTPGNQSQTSQITFKINYNGTSTKQKNMFKVRNKAGSSTHLTNLYCYFEQILISGGVLIWSWILKKKAIRATSFNFILELCIFIFEDFQRFLMDRLQILILILSELTSFPLKSSKNVGFQMVLERIEVI